MVDIENGEAAFQVIGFDFDGTLADTLPLSIEAFRQGVSPCAGHRLSDEEIIATFGLSEEGMIAQLVEGPRLRAIALDDYHRAYKRLHAALVSGPFSGITKLLADLGRAGAATVLVTGKGEFSCRMSLELLGLSDAFDRVFFGSATHPRKDVQMCEAMTAYGVGPERFCYVGDAVSDVEVCRSVGVSCLSAAWQPGTDAAQLEAINPGWVFRSVDALRGYLLEGRRTGVSLD